MTLHRSTIRRAVTAILAFLFCQLPLIAQQQKLGALGPPPIPLDNKLTPEKIALGKLLFFDPRLSGDGTVSCATCHDPKKGWQDNERICTGYPGTVHIRNCQTVINAAYYQKLFWAGAATSLESQAKMAASGAIAGNGEGDMMPERLAQVPQYEEMFRRAFGTLRPMLGDAWRAISAFERTLVQRDTPFDRYMKGDENALGAQEKAGLKIFKGKGRCITCHNGPFFTDQKYYNMGTPPTTELQTSHLHQISFRFAHYAKGVPEDVYRKVKTDLGLYFRRKANMDMGKFRTPTLRYLKYTAPYMHNGSLATLADVIEFYNRGGDADPILGNFGFPTKSNLVQPLGLNASEKKALEAFLLSLSGKEIIVEPPTLPKDAVMVRRNAKATIQDDGRVKGYLEHE